TDAHATGIQRRVRSPVDHKPTVLRTFGPVAVTPHAREAVKIRRAIFCAVRIVPELNGHRRERRSADQLPLSFARAQRTSLVVPHLHRHTEPRSLNFAWPDGPRRHPADKTTDNVRPAGDGGE